MKIKSLQLKNFKRFTDLTLQNIPDNAKLVLLIGSNGSGKSSVFDGFEVINKRLRDDDKFLSFQDEKHRKYYHKIEGKSFEVRFTADNNEREQYITTQSGNIINSGNSFIGRSAVRYLPKLTKTVLGTTLDIKADSDRPQYYNEIDKRFENDIDLIMEDIVKRVFGDFSNGSSSQIDEVYVFRQRINDSLKNIFSVAIENALLLESILPPVDGKPIQINFTKGGSTFHYDLLSSGEKEIINLLFNLYTRTKVFQNSIYFIDEMDSHLNTSLQYSLLKEVTENWIPENCQLWTASHSLGFIQYAKESNNAATLDFDDLDFDQPQTLSPVPKDNTEIFEIALSKDFINKLLEGRNIIFSENTDTQLYNNLALNNTFFFNAIDKNDVFHKAKNFNQKGLIDRDYLSDEEVIAMKEIYPFLYILPYYSIENLLYHPTNLEEYYRGSGKDFDATKYIEALTIIKNTERIYLSAGIVQARAGYPFYKENDKAKGLKEFKDNYRDVIDLLVSDDFETFYKVFPAKDLGKQIPERQNLSKTELAKTHWFKAQIEQLIK